MNDEPWATDGVSWQGFFCRRRAALVGASVAIFRNGETEPLVTVHPCRKLFWFWIWDADRRLVNEVADYLLENGARPVEPAASEATTGQRGRTR
jgi:hypothetical protein